MSAGLSVQIEGLAELQDQLRELTELEYRDLLDEVGALVESQTRRRIGHDKTAPDGAPWEPWSERYAATRHDNQSLLVSEGNLLDSIQYVVDDDTVEVGSNMIYAATHQYGDRRKGWGKVEVEIPARPYLGLSATDADEAVDVIQRFIARRLHA